MTNYNIREAILISTIIGAVLISIFGISGLLSLIIIGFIATYLTAPEKRTYKVGGISGGVLSVLIFIYGFFTSPILPYDLPNASNFGITFIINGIFTLIFGFIIVLALSVIMGSIGGKIAEKIFKKRKISRKGGKRFNQRNFKNKKPRRTLNRTHK